MPVISTYKCIIWAYPLALSISGLWLNDPHTIMNNNNHNERHFRVMDFKITGCSGFKVYGIRLNFHTTYLHNMTENRNFFLTVNVPKCYMRSWVILRHWSWARYYIFHVLESSPCWRTKQNINTVIYPKPLWTSLFLLRSPFEVYSSKIFW